MNQSISTITCILCPVDINNEFIFNGQKYQISKKVRQYEISNFYETDAKMDNVLVLQDGKKIIFADQNMDKINNKYIRKI